jgi:ribosome-binding protein aMBF1 (putative translation factor)
VSETKSLGQWRASTSRNPVPRPKSVQVEDCYCRIGEICLEMRERRGWPQAHVADAMNWTRANVSGIETGRIRVMMHDLPRLARVLGLPVRDLLPPEWIRVTAPSRRR